MTYCIYIDGRQGTTGIEIDQHLSSRDDIQLLNSDPDRRKDPSYKREMFEEADIVILCVPDEVARSAAELGADVRLIDASTAHRTAEGWTYGLPELNRTNRGDIRSAQRVSNPGCYPTGFLIAIRPLIDAGLVARDAQLQVHAVSGYSGGGKSMIERYRQQPDALLDTRFYSLGLPHKHLPEMQIHSGLKNAPFFLPSVGPFFKGMIVKTVLTDVTAEEVERVWEKRYANEQFIRINTNGDSRHLEDGFLSAMRCNDSNMVELLAVESNGYTLICAVLDNLGKGASGAAVQNMNLMLGLDESLGLDSKSI